VAKTILVADDDAHIRKILCEMFELEKDYELCEQAKNGKEAVEIATRCKPDLVILDFSMPVMSGIQAAKLIKAQMPEVPIILFTMHEQGMFGQVNSFIAPLIDRVVQKTDIALLLGHVRELAPV
jgi:YesN/AraC family two-component response regulator